jgi:hypothetical protein
LAPNLANSYVDPVQTAENPLIIDWAGAGEWTGIVALVVVAVIAYRAHRGNEK